MNGLTFLFIAMLGFLAASPQAVDPRSHPLDTKASTVTWTGSKVAGMHTGLVSISSGSFTIQDGKLMLADIAMDMGSISCTDLSDPARNAKLVGHLKGSDFFAVDLHPSATFKTTMVESLDQGSTGANYRVTGTLTVKGISNPNTFEVAIRKDGNAYRASGTLRFDRTQYGIRYGSGSFIDGLGDRMISDVVVLDFNVVTR